MGEEEGGKRELQASVHNHDSRVKSRRPTNKRIDKKTNAETYMDVYAAMANQIKSNQEKRQRCIAL